MKLAVSEFINNNLGDICKYKTDDLKRMLTIKIESENIGEIGDEAESAQLLANFRLVEYYCFYVGFIDSVLYDLNKQGKINDVKFGIVGDCLRLTANGNMIEFDIFNEEPDNFVDDDGDVLSEEEILDFNEKIIKNGTNDISCGKFIDAYISLSNNSSSNLFGSDGRKELFIETNDTKSVTEYTANKFRKYSVTNVFIDLFGK